MKAKDIIQYEVSNQDTILLIVNKSVCRVFETSAYWLSKHIPMDKLYNKYSRSLDTRMIYAWFSVRRLNKVLDELHAKGFHPVARKEGYIVLKKEGAKPDDYDEWRERVYDGVMVNQVYIMEEA
ncbi:MAG: hypothetical protein LBG19_09010 [Prevotellaceae bacterium]|nr:hypothetical protein [Prevotellaceae bacterium]